MDNDEFRSAWEEKRKSKPSKFSKKSTAERKQKYQDNRKDFGDDRTTSAWPEVNPQSGMHTIKLIVGSDLEAIETLLEEGVRQRDLPLHKVDFAKGLVQFGSRFIKGTVSIDEATNTYSDQKQPWLQSDGVYLFKNIEPILGQTNLLVEFFRGLYALRKGEVDKTLFTDGSLIKNNISMCIICTKEHYGKLIAAHNKLKADFQLATVVDMAI
ncbi:MULTISPECIES: hypothetical protein [unclassified Colwellia]|jgi:hypothetical protein|uniref:hypothetical protein n=1 Tax=unclassified Colwellia TaxID=196834 RepID=UPI0015F68007|nr:MULTISPECIES: hypothetical protein [unclassified Colwellia]MBA6379696.1 hypothetical protein [Colwellia sp. BRX10-7]MBA6388489.1 hypothetical protein [Colwellia sp. BRX10-2]MBA6402997.1 hypothetical protein [Colwellia sp. BRX10-5]MBA6406314.1 hypothetical protein [Colwellia sp. BRX10-1]